MSQVFDAYARYYDLLYKDKNYLAEAEYIDSNIRRHAPKAKRILELGCGTGAHAEHLARMGYTVHGVDLSEEMLARAEARKSALPADIAARMSFSIGDVRTVRTGEVYDTVISLFHVMSYQSTNADLVAAFDTASAHLTTGGLFVFDFWYGPAVLTQQPVVRVKRLEDDEIIMTRIAEPVMHVNDNCVDVNYDIFVELKTGGILNIQEKHTMRYLFKPELEYFLKSDVWRKYESSAWLENNELSDDSWAGFVIAVRR